MLNNLDKVDANNGAKILDHIFGNQQENVTEEIDRNYGVSAANIDDILKYLAPILMGMIGS